MVSPEQLTVLKEELSIIVRSALRRCDYSMEVVVLLVSLVNERPKALSYPRRVWNGIKSDWNAIWDSGAWRVQAWPFVRESTSALWSAFMLAGWVFSLPAKICHAERVAMFLRK